MERKICDRSIETMARKKRPDAEKVAEELAELAVRHLSRFSEKEQEQRILAAEKRLATASRAGSPRVYPQVSSR
jgi:hypothetical protein